MSVTTHTHRVAMRNISMSFGPNKVLDDVSVGVGPGEVVGLVGQNGAGKSTLMKILGGVYPGHQGRIEVDGTAVELSSPTAALHAGIGMIYQELSLIHGMTVLENIMLGNEPAGLRYRSPRASALPDSLLSRVPLLGRLPLNATVGGLSAGLQQQVEIAKALTRKARILVMDEPTARLSGPERAELRELISHLAASGASVIYISHFLDEIFDTTSRVVVLRNGRVVDEGPTRQFTPSSLTRSMLNKELLGEIQRPHRGKAPDSPVVLSARDLASEPRLHGVTLELRAGEILGVAGLVGSGRTRLARTIVGADQRTGGQLEVAGRPVHFSSPRAALRSGVVLLPEDRKADGIFAQLGAADNLLLPALDAVLSRFGVVRAAESRRVVSREFASLEIHPPQPGLSAVSFSGGNQQKILLGRALISRPSVLIADQPTTGVDVGTKAQIHTLLRDAAAAGTGLVVISDDLDELLALSDRILLMSAGRVTGVLGATGLDRARLVAAIAGEDPASPAKETTDA